jgi:hypothetical protein
MKRGSCRCGRVCSGGFLRWRDFWARGMVSSCDIKKSRTLRLSSLDALRIQIEGIWAYILLMRPGDRSIADLNPLEIIHVFELAKNPKVQEMRAAIETDLATGECQP